MSYNIKQVIVMRKDLNMRKGKMVAQGAHASLGVVLAEMSKEDNGKVLTMTLKNDGYLRSWLVNSFAKICVSVDSEAELLDIYEKAKAANLPAVLITDNGATEFNGVPTNTCIGIGPWDSEEINKITGHLKLL